MDNNFLAHNNKSLFIWILKNAKKEFQKHKQNCAMVLLLMFIFDLHFKTASSLQYNKVKKKQIQMLIKYFLTSITRTNMN